MNVAHFNFSVELLSLIDEKREELKENIHEIKFAVFSLLTLHDMIRQTKNGTLAISCPTDSFLNVLTDELQSFSTWAPLNYDFSKKKVFVLKAFVF